MQQTYAKPVIGTQLYQSLGSVSISLSLPLIEAADLREKVLKYYREVPGGL